jgi:tRNA threonylcarbamoyl adenosine modification protein YeaZ
LPPEPLILGFDTSAAHCAAALVSGGRILVARHEAMLRGQAERLFPMLEEVLAEAGVGWGDLAALGVGTGPGNFTGVRVAVSAARGLALALQVPAVGVTGFEALGHGIKAPALASLPGLRGQVALQVVGGAAPTACAPVVCDPGDLPAIWRGSRLDAIGAEAALLAGQTGGRAIDRVVSAAPAIALVALARRSGAVARPAPFYLRAADAAPSADRPPVILD